MTLCALSEFLPALPAAVEEDFSSFSNFLEKILLHVGDYIWNCPRILSFLDNALKVPSIRDSHLSVLTEEVIVYSTICRSLSIPIFEK